MICVYLYESFQQEKALKKEASHVPEIDPYDHMYGQGTDLDAAMHMSSTLIPLSRAVDTATLCVECAPTTEVRFLSACL